VIVPINFKKCDGVREAALKLYEMLKNKNIEVLLDDRNERAGVLFSDHDLIGIPLRVVIGDKGLKDGKVEVLDRASKEAVLVEVGNAEAYLLDAL